MTMLGALLKKTQEDTSTKNKDKKKINLEIRRRNNARLQEDFFIFMRRLREDTEFSILHNRNLPVRGLDYRFIAVQERAKNAEKMIEPSLMAIWTQNKTWAKQNGLKLKIVFEKDKDTVFDWYSVYFELGE